MRLSKLAASTAMAIAVLGTADAKALPADKPAANNEFVDDIAIREITSFFSDMKDGKEHVVYCLPNSRLIADVTEANGTRVAKPNLKAVQSLPSDDYVLIAHNHHVGIDDYLRFAQPTELGIAMIKRADPRLVEKRMFLEVPSDGDVSALAYEEAGWLAKSPKARIRHLLVRTSEYHAPRVIEYGFTPQKAASFVGYFKAVADSCKAPAAESKACIDAKAGLNDAVVAVTADYSKVWQAHTQDALKPGELGPGKEVSLEEFIQSLTPEVGVFVRDLGFYNAIRPK